MLFLKAVIRHVPKTYIMKCTYSSCASLRSVIIYEMVRSDSHTLLSSLSKEEVDCYLNVLKNFCPNFVTFSPLLKEQLWNMCEGGKYNFTTFLSPPVSTCLHCERDISMHNPPSKAKVFTHEGPIPVTKITLECKLCKTSYTIVRYTHNGGSHYYPKAISMDLMKVSNTTYI